MKNETVYWQTDITFPPFKRGFHFITQSIVDELYQCPKIQIGLLNIFIQHTSASLTLSENTCQEVKTDLESTLNRLVPDDSSLYLHTIEGEDDMPAHVKNTLLGSSLTLPIRAHALVLGQWQGIFLCEHRNQASSRTLTLTAQGSI